jgi:hypothetical protein
MNRNSENGARPVWARNSVQKSLGAAFSWLRSDAASYWLLFLILLIAAYLRLSHVNWDQGTHIHPDERFLTMVEDSLRLPQSLSQFFDSTTSPMNPYNQGFGFFVYGTLPIFIVRVMAEMTNNLNQVAMIWTAAPDIPLSLIGYGGVHFVGRVLSGLFDLAGVALIFVIGRRLYSKKVGLLAAALLAFAVLPLQQSHFFTVLTTHVLFCRSGRPGRPGGASRRRLGRLCCSRGKSGCERGEPHQFGPVGGHSAAGGRDQSMGRLASARGIRWSLAVHTGSGYFVQVARYGNCRVGGVPRRATLRLRWDEPIGLQPFAAVAR